MSFGFANPWALALLPLLLIYAWMRRGRRGPALAYSRTPMLRALTGRGARRIAAAPAWLRGLCLALLVIALAGPRTGLSSTDVDSDGIAIMLVVDISSSMLAEDFHPNNRLTVAKATVRDFIRGREADRIGMVAFAGEALTQVPLTIDYDVLYEAIENMEIGLLDDGTAIGTAIATGANRLRRAAGQSRVMILMTDGENNRGEIDPFTAAQAASAFGIKIYTIGVGSEGVAPIPVARGLLGGYQYANLPVHIDEKLLTSIADVSGGEYFRATHEQALDSIYQRIDQLEKTTVTAKRYVDFTPRYLPFLLLAAGALLLEWLLRASRWGRVP